jgi:hypothetical protein
MLGHLNRPFYELVRVVPYGIDRMVNGALVQRSVTVEALRRDDGVGVINPLRRIAKVANMSGLPAALSTLAFLPQLSSLLPGLLLFRLGLGRIGRGRHGAVPGARVEPGLELSDSLLQRHVLVEQRKDELN